MLRGCDGPAAGDCRDPRPRRCRLPPPQLACRGPPAAHPRRRRQDDARRRRSLERPLRAQRLYRGPRPSATSTKPRCGPTWPSSASPSAPSGRAPPSSTASPSPPSTRSPPAGADIEAALAEQGAVVPRSPPRRPLWRPVRPRHLCPGSPNYARPGTSAQPSLGIGPEVVAGLATGALNFAPDCEEPARPAAQSRTASPPTPPASTAELCCRPSPRLTPQARRELLRASADVLLRSPSSRGPGDAPPMREPRYSTAELLARRAELLERAERQRGAGRRRSPRQRPRASVLAARPSLSA